MTIPQQRKMIFRLRLGLAGVLASYFVLAAPAGAAEFENLLYDNCGSRGIGGHTQDIAVADRTKLYKNPNASLKDFSYYLHNTGINICTMQGARAAVWTGFWIFSDTHEGFTLAPNETKKITFNFGSGPPLSSVQRYLDVYAATSELNCHPQFDICFAAADRYGTDPATALDGEIGKDLAMQVNSVETAASATTSSPAGAATTTATTAASTASTSAATSSGAYDHDPVAARAGSLDINGDKSLVRGTTLPSCVSGMLLKTAASTTVSYCGADGKRYVFPNEKTYFTWYENWRGIVTVPDERMAAIPIGGNVTYRPGAKLLKIESDQKVYAVEKNGLLRWLPTTAAAAALYGQNWLNLVEDLPDPFFVNYRRGTDVK